MARRAGAKMGKQSESSRSARPDKRDEITGLLVGGYKSICQDQEIEIRPLTVLAGANSSGKSSMMQPLLLLKQTLEATYDPGPLLLNGPNVRFTEVNQFLCAVKSAPPPRDFRVGMRVPSGDLVVTSFRKGDKQPLDLCETRIHTAAGEPKVLTGGMERDALIALVPDAMGKVFTEFHKAWQKDVEPRCERERCFLRAEFTVGPGFPVFNFSPGTAVEHLVREAIHLPGLRGNPERTYPVTAVGRSFPGTFEHYVASVIAQWEAQRDVEKLNALCSDLERLGLTWKVGAKKVSDTEVELSVGRLRHAARGGAYDVVSIADVGFGVSQVLPLVVALHVARPGQLVYVEQPELHLHPRAQAALAEVLADAAKRHVKVVAETHSATLLVAIQALVVEGSLPNDIVKLHWFQRSEVGATVVTSADLDSKGAFGDWPEDFAQVAMQTESRYLDAVESRHG
jgi:hypothetical protein